MRWRLYFDLTKPRLALGNLLVAVAAFVFAVPPEALAKEGLPGMFVQGLLMFFGLWFIIGSGCVFNNVYDREIDAKMERTRERALVTGVIKKTHALVFGSVLLALGIALLYVVNWFALSTALVGWISYVLLYTPIKHRSSIALYVGAIAGATPPVVGYTAAAGILDWYAAGLFLIIYLWQLPHFLAIARYRYSDYAAANIPLAVAEPQSDAERMHARKIFHASLVGLLIICGALILQRWIR